jgi:hypothetical protein
MFWQSHSNVFATQALSLRVQNFYNPFPSLVVVQLDNYNFCIITTFVKLNGCMYLKDHTTCSQSNVSVSFMQIYISSRNVIGVKEILQVYLIVKTSQV